MKDSYVIIISFMIYFIIGILMFFNGFLLNRVEVHDISECSNNVVNNSRKGRETGCWGDAKFKKAIVILIDALRYDFVSPMNSSVSSKYFHNKFHHVNELLHAKPHNSVLFKFVADPPTTTMQRLKGLTSGSLPTFVDASANFASPSIKEDNLVNQLIRKGMKIHFMGDDTWLDLFPNSFAKSLPFPSLNVKDLHTVDDGILKNLLPEINDNSADIVIAHFLGVDHCGHTFGPDHPQMEAKLKQMDDMIRSVVESVDDDTLLLVFGDHGMTRTGDHGGDSANELDAALFMYARKGLVSSNPVQVSEDQSVAQIDLVPTLSLLLGLPIPFSNLGMVIPELFTSSIDPGKQSVEILNALRLNAHQVRIYLQRYSQASDEMSTRKMADFESILQKAEDLISQGGIGSQGEASRLYTQYLQGVRAMCQELWAKFDLPVMFLGVAMVTFSMITCTWTAVMYRFSINDSVSILPNLINCPMIALAFLLIAIKLKLVITIILFSIAGTMLLIITWFHCRKKSKGSTKLYSVTRISPLLTCALLGVYVLGSFSNSYVVNEDSMTAFLAQSGLLLLCFIINTKLRNREDLKLSLGAGGVSVAGKANRRAERLDLGRMLTSPRALCIMLLLACMVCVRLGVLTRACREEQWSCDPPALLKPLPAIPESERGYRSMRYFLAIACNAVLPCIVWGLLRHWGNLNGITVTSMFARHVLPLCWLCLAVHWAMQVAPHVPEWALTAPPRIVYAAVLISTCLLFWRPLALHVLPRSSRADHVPLNSQSGVPEVFEHVKRNWRRHLVSGGVSKQKEEPRDPPLVYGLATVYSAAVITLLAGVGVVCALLLGDGVSLSVPLHVLAMLGFLELHACALNLSHDVIGERRHFVPWSSVIGWCILTSHYFFAMGHQTTVPSIRFEAAYVGFTGDHSSHVLPALLIVLNTCASHVLGVLALPLLVTWPLSRGVPIHAFASSKQGDGEARKGEFVLHETPGLLRRVMTHLCLAYLACVIAKVLGAMAAAGLHRRHLMVWKIFAPHLVYEAAGVGVVCVTLLLVWTLMVRVDARLTRWVLQL